MSAGFMLTFAVTCILSPGRIFWEDEMLGWMLLRDPSWHHMVFAYNSGADGGGFLFYLLGRGWFWLFGPSELAFRLFSTTCFGLAFAVTWAAARRFYSIGVVAFALFNTWFFSPPFVAHMAEGRFYGLLVLGVALAVALVFALDPDSNPTKPWPYAAMFLVHALLTTSHLLGVVFSASLLAAMVVLDLLARRPRLLLYLTGMVAWLLLIPERANILASARVGRPWFWTRAPRALELIAVYTGSSKEIALLLLLLLCIATGTLFRGKTATQASLRGAWQARRPVYVVLTAMFLLSVAVLLEGLVGTWLFNDRYLLPMTVAVAYLTAELAQFTLAGAASSPAWQRLIKAPAWRIGTGLAFAAALLYWDFRHLATFSPSPKDYTAALTAKLPRGLPVVCEDAFTFTELLGRQHASGVAFDYLLDWVQTVSPAAPRLEVTQYHLMESWRKLGYFSGSIQPIEQFLQRYREFVVVHTEAEPPTHRPPEIGNPLAQRFAQNPAYQVVLLGHVDHAGTRDTIWRICYRVCSGAESILP